MCRKTTAFFIILFFLAPWNSFSEDTPFYVPLFSVDDRLIIETKWQYTYALHVESNTIIHKAENYYDFFLYFKFNFTYEQYLNGNFSKGNWSLHENELLYSFRNIKKFTIAEITKNILVLEFSQPNSKGKYQYHFIRVENEDAPFLKPVNELPLVKVNATIAEEEKIGSKRSWWFFGKKRRERRNKKEVVALEYISVELIGGGYYGGIDPVLRDYILIKSNGRLIKEFKSMHNGLIITKKNIPREELEQFVEYVTKQNFFEFERMYDCDSPMCQDRKRKKPTPIPLRLAIAHGNRKKVVTINIWGKDEYNVKYIDYPPALDNIIDAIQRMAFREDS